MKKQAIKKRTCRTGLISMIYINAILLSLRRQVLHNNIHLILYIDYPTEPKHLYTTTFKIVTIAVIVTADR